VGLLAEVINSLPQGRLLKEANIYTSTDDDLVIDVFQFDNTSKPHRKYNPQSSADNQSVVFKDIFTAFEAQSVGTQELLVNYLLGCDFHFVMSTPPSETVKHFQLFHEAQRTDNIVVDLFNVSQQAANSASPSVDETDVSTLVVVTKRETDDIFARIVKYLSRQKIDITKATLNRVEDHRESSVLSRLKPNYLIITLYIRPVSGPAIDVDTSLADQLCRDLRMLQYLDSSVLRWVEKKPDTSIGSSEIMACLCKLLHCILADERPLVFTQYHIDQFVEQNQDVMAAILHMWDLKLV
jgi:hypothetical protein